MFNITLYKTTSERNEIKKKLTEVITISGSTKENFDVINPSILVSLEGIPDANYCYVDVTDKYYYVRYVAENNGLIRLNLFEDVLMSFKTPLLNCEVLVSRSKDGDPYINGDNFVETSQTATEVINFNNGFLENPLNILISAGGE